MEENNPIEIYQAADGQTAIEVRLQGETVWLNRQQLAELFGRDVKTIGKHVNNVFREGELAQNAVVANFATTESPFNSSRKIDEICLPIVFISLSNKIAICCLFWK